MLKILSLLEANSLVREVVEVSMPDAYWVEAELSELRENGHCYMELSQKDPDSNTPVARARAICWRNVWARVRPRFERVTGQRLRAGMKVLLLVHASFHENYGFSWQVEDIDPDYTLGDMERKRREIIRKLKEEDVYDLQRQLDLPLFAQRIAVISSETAAGYGDFRDQLLNNEDGFRFYLRLFPSAMQGDQVERSVIAALDAIHAMEASFDCVVIIRGGGATSDLSGFDTLSLAENVANFPLPVLTGIGHERDESVLDLVAYRRLKTPTAVAAFLVEHLRDVSKRIDMAGNTIQRAVERRVRLERLRLESLAGKLPVLFSGVRVRQLARLETLFAKLSSGTKSLLKENAQVLRQNDIKLRAAVRRKLDEESHRLESLDRHVRLLDPQLMLVRGYSITLKDGKVVRDAGMLSVGDEIETRLAQGNVKSLIKNKTSRYGRENEVRGGGQGAGEHRGTHGE